MNSQIKIEVDGKEWLLRHDLGAISRYCRSAKVKTWEEYFRHTANPVKFVGVAYELGNRKENEGWSKDHAESLPFELFGEVMIWVNESAEKLKPLMEKMNLPSEK